MLPLATGRTIYGVAGTAAAITCTIVGDPIAAGVDGFDELDQRQLPVSAALLYTVPGSASLIGEIHLQNTTGSAVSGIKFFVGGTSASNQIINLTIPGGGSALYNHEGWSVRDSGGVLLTTVLVSITGDATGSGTTTVPVTVTKLQGNPVSAAAPSTGNALVWDGSAWTPTTAIQTLAAADASVTVGGTVTARTVATGRADQIFALHPPTASINFNSQEAINAADPTLPQSLTTKAYVDNLIAALPSQPIVNYATTAALPAVTYANGASGVGATLTAAAPGILTVDGVPVTTLGTSVLVQNQASLFQNGIFTTTTVGTALVPFVLTRRTTFDTAAEMGTAVLVPIDDQGLSPGLTNDDKVFLSLTSAPFVVGTTGINFQLIGSTYSADGTSITLSGTQFSRNALTGDVTAPAGSSVTTLASVITAGGPTGSASVVPVITWDAKGRLTVVTTATITPAAIGAVASITNVDGTITISGTATNPVVSRAGITGDLTVSAGSNLSTLATVNTNVGTFGDASHVTSLTVNGKGLITAASNVLITPGAIGAPSGSGTSTGANTGDVTLGAVGSSPNANAASLAGQVLTLQPANGSFPGLLSAAGFTNLGNQSGVNTGDQTITLTSDVTGSGTGSFATTIAPHAVTNAKSAQMAAHTYKGNNTGSTADPIDVTLAQLKTELLLSGTNTGDQTITLTGDVTGSGTGSFATLLASVITAGGPTGSGTSVPVLTYDAKGRLTAVTTAATVGTVTATDSSIVVGGTATAPTIQRAALTGDITASAGSNTTTLTSVITAGGPTGSGTVVPVITWDAKGRLTAVTTAAITPGGIGAVASVTNADGTIVVTGTATNPVVSRAGITGDVSVAAAGNASVLATVNSNVGSFGDSSHVATFTVNGKGLTTAAASVLITPAAIGAVASVTAADASITIGGTATNPTVATGRLDQIATLHPPTAAVNFNGQEATNAATPSAGSSLATKTYVDSVASGVMARHFATAVGTANQALTGLPTLDTITLTSGQIALLTGQSTGSQNGLWAVAAGAWTRPTFFATGFDAVGSYVILEQGAVFAGSEFFLVGASPITVDTTAQTWVQINGAYDITVDATLTKSGNQLSRAAITGDISISVGSNAATLASVIVAGGPTGSTSVVPVITWDAKGRLTAVTTATITPAAIGAVASVTNSDGTITVTGTGTNPVVSRPAITGDISISTASNVSTLASVITAGGPTGSASVVPVITWDAKGRLTTVTTATITPAAIGAPSGSGTSSGANTGDVTLTAVGATPNANGASLSGQALTLQPANASNPGLLSAAGFTNLGNQSGVNTGDQTITLTGNVTGSGTGSFATTIAAHVITPAMQVQVAAHTFRGNNSGATADLVDMTTAQAKTELNLAGTNTGDQTITLTGDVSGSGTGSFAATLAGIITAGGPTGDASHVPVITWDAKGRLTVVSSATITPAAIGAPSGSGTSSGANTGDQTITLTGPVTGSGTGSFATTVTPHVITPAMQQQMATGFLKGNFTGSTADEQDVPIATVAAAIPAATYLAAGTQAATSFALGKRTWDSWADFGIVEDLRKAEEITTVGTQQVIAASGTTLTIPNAGASTPFTSTAVDGGKRVTINGAGTAGAMYVGTIVSITNSTTAVVTPAAGTTVTATTSFPVMVQWGTDNTTATNNMVTAINAQTYPCPEITFGKYANPDWTGSIGFPTRMSFSKSVYLHGTGGSYTTDVGDYTKTGGTRLAWWGTSSDGGTPFGAFITITPSGVASVPTFVRSFTNTSGTSASTSAVGQLNAGGSQTPTAGDMLIATISGGDGGTINSVPSGWNPLSTVTVNGGLISNLYYKVAQAGEPATWTWGMSVSSHWAASVTEYSGVSTSAVPQANLATGSSVSSFATPLVTTTTNGDAIIGIVTGVVNLSGTTNTFTLPGSTTQDSQGGGNASVANNVATVTIHDTTNQAAAGATTARTLTSAQSMNNVTSYVVALAPASGSSQAIKRPRMEGVWLDCRNGDQNQALYGLKLASAHAAIIEGGFMVQDALAQGLWCDISTAPAEAADTTRFDFRQMCFRQLDNTPGASTASTTVTAATATALPTSSGPTLTLTSVTGYTAAGGYAWVMTVIGQLVLIKYATVTGSTLTNCIVSAEDFVNTPTTFVNAQIVPCQPGLGGAMKLSGGTGHNTCCGMIENVQISYGLTFGQAAIDCGNADSIIIKNVMMNGGSNVTETNGNRQRRPGIRLNGSNVSNTLACRNMVIEDTDPGGAPSGALGGISAMGVLNTGAMMGFPSGPSYVLRQQMGNGAPVPTVELGAFLSWSGNGMFQEGGMASLGANVTLATGGAVTGLAVPIPPQGWQVGTVIEYDLKVQKGAAGTSLAAGIRQNSAITTAAGTLIANAAFTGTAVADVGTLKITLAVSGPLGATCAGISEYELRHNLVSTAGVGTGLFTGAITAGSLVSATSNAGYPTVLGAMTTWNSVAPGSGPQFLYLDLITGATSITLLAGSTVKCLKAAL